MNPLNCIPSIDVILKILFFSVVNVNDALRIATASTKLKLLKAECLINTKVIGERWCIDVRLNIKIFP